jgi:hypothetical protein
MRNRRSVNAAPPPPPPAKVATMPARAASDMQAVLDQLPRLGAKPIETLTPVKARIQPSAADAAMAVMHAKRMSTAPDPTVVTTDMAYGPDPMQFARIYKPAGAPSGTPMPVIVYYHGGGWVIADVNTYDAAPRLLSKQLNAIVVSVEFATPPKPSSRGNMTMRPPPIVGCCRMPNPGVATSSAWRWPARARAATWPSRP